jgi:hypothetical protein
VLVGPEPVVRAMNDTEVARRLLAELREAYWGLPQHIQVHVACLLRDSALHRQTGQQSCELTFVCFSGHPLELAVY